MLIAFRTRVTILLLGDFCWLDMMCYPRLERLGRDCLGLNLC